LILLGQPFDAARAEQLGIVTRVVGGAQLLAVATETAQGLAEKPAVALQSCKRLLKQPMREQVLQAIQAENVEFSERVRSADTKEAIHAFFEKRPPDFTSEKAMGVR
jgi:enoyl-CoA hydratase/carnithine racemase